MLTFSEAQFLAWVSPVLWPFARVLALFTVMPVFSNRAVPRRVRIALAFFIALAAQAALPPAPVIALDSAAALLVLLQQLFIGLAIGFAVRIVFAAFEFAGELVGLQMGLNFASFFDPTTGGQATAMARFFGTMATLLFLVLDGHLVVIAALAQSFHAFPVSPEPLALLRELQPQRWGAEIFRSGLWIALPMVAMLVFVNLVLGVVARVAQQMNIFAIGFPLTLTVGLLGVALTLPLLQAPFAALLERMLGMF